MRFKAPFCSGNSTFPAAPVLRYRSGIAPATLLATLCVLAAGCGSGTVGVTAPQNIATPVASAKGPQLGYIWMDSDKTLRPILGVAGASQIGQSVVPAAVYIGAVASATANVAILQDTTGAFDLMTLPSGSPSSLGLTLGPGASVRLSPGATSALVYTPGATSASLVTGLLSTPEVHTITSPGTIADSAVSDTGTVSFAYAQGSSFTIGVVAFSGSSAGRSTPIASVKSIGGLNFLPGHDDLLFADTAASSLTLVRSTTSAPSVTPIQTAQLLKNPAAVGVSGSGRWALIVNGVANSGSQSLVRVDLSTLTSTGVTCSCKPTVVATLADDGAFRVTGASNGPAWIVDAAPATPRTLFIPAIPATSAANASLVASVVAP